MSGGEPRYARLREYRYTLSGDFSDNCLQGQKWQRPRDFFYIYLKRKTPVCIPNYFYGPGRTETNRGYPVATMMNIRGYQPRTNLGSLYVV